MYTNFYTVHNSVDDHTVVEIPETMAPFVGGLKVGQKIKALITYQVVEKTKSFTVLRIGYVQEVKSKRII